MKNKSLTLSDIAELLNAKKDTIKKRAQKDKWKHHGNKVQGGQEHRFYLLDLPEYIQSAYATKNDIPLDDLLNELRPKLPQEPKVNIPGYAGREAKTPEIKPIEEIPEKDLKVAALKVKVIEAYSAFKVSVSSHAVEKFVAAYNKGEIVPDLRERLGPHGDITSPSSFYRWLEQYRKHGIAGLAPQYTGKGAGASLTQEEKDRIEWLYLDSSQPTIAVVYEILVKQYGLKTSESTVRNYINSIPDWIKAKHRKGNDYFNAKFNPYITRDYTKYKPMEIICGDYMTQDIVCRRENKVFRARLCAFEDMRSRTIVGWSLQETANSIGVIRALQMTFRDYGLPEKIYVDNGKEFKNYLLCGDQWKAQKTKIDPELLDLDVGILAECMIKIIFCQAYHGQSKPIERFWRFFHERFDKFEVTYMGSNTADRPDEVKDYRANVEDMKKVDISQIPTFEQVEERIRKFINWYNEQWKHSGQGMDDRTPMDVFKEYAVLRREIPSNLKKYLFTMRYIRTVQRNGIELDGLYYQSKNFAEYNGRKVEVRRGLDDTGTVHIFSIPDRLYLFDAEHLALSGVPQEDIQKMGKLRKDMKELAKRYNKKKAEYDKGVFKTPAELYAEETRKVVNGEPISTNADTPTALKVITLKTPKRKIKGIFDVD